MAEDKFFTTVLDRFNHHATPVRDNLRGLEWVDSDYFGHLSPSFKENLDKIRKCLDEMEEAVRDLRSR